MRILTVSKNRGFTLVELLVVIGIIALLISVLLPALSKARDQANTVACLANMRSLGQAIQIYEVDTKWMIPAAYWQKFGAPAGVTTMGSKIDSTWANILVDGRYISYPPETYINSRNPGLGISDGPIARTPFFCPAGLTDVSPNITDPNSATDGLGAVAFRSQSAVTFKVVDCWYGMNASTQTANSGIADVHSQPARVWPFDDSSGTPANVSDSYEMLRPTVVRKPAEVVLLYDGFWMNASIGNAYRINARHNRKTSTNLLFCDGHAVTKPRNALPMKYTDFTLAQLALPQFSSVKWRIDQ